MFFFLKKKRNNNNIYQRILALVRGYEAKFENNAEFHDNNINWINAESRLSPHCTQTIIILLFYMFICI